MRICVLLLVVITASYAVGHNNFDFYDGECKCSCVCRPPRPRDCENPCSICDTLTEPDSDFQDCADNKHMAYALSSYVSCCEKLEEKGDKNDMADFQSYLSKRCEKLGAPFTWEQCDNNGNNGNSKGNSNSNSNSNSNGNGNGNGRGRGKGKGKGRGRNKRGAGGKGKKSYAKAARNANCNCKCECPVCKQDPCIPVDKCNVLYEPYFIQTCGNKMASDILIAQRRYCYTMDNDSEKIRALFDNIEGVCDIKGGAVKLEIPEDDCPDTTDPPCDKEALCDVLDSDTFMEACGNDIAPDILEDAREYCRTWTSAAEVRLVLNNIEDICLAKGHQFDLHLPEGC